MRTSFGIFSRVILLAFFLTTSGSIAQDNVLECSTVCYDPDLSLGEGDVFAWEFTNMQILMDQFPQSLSSVKITLLQPLNGLWESVNIREVDYLEIFATIFIQRIDGDRFTELQVPLSSLPMPLIFPSITNLNGTLVNSFETWTAEKSNWDEIEVWGSGITMFTDHSVGNRTIENGIYSFSQSTRLESQTQNDISVSYQWSTLQFTIDTGLLIEFNSTTISGDGIRNSMLINQVNPPSEELSIDTGPLLIILVSILVLSAIGVLIYLYFKRSRS
ncbi:MAG: hypothetical protein GPJ54_09060 [Candidatus Heimdallarchaeota archaeon]|nr:hypothetical protein [Candidatus Heimdallarchaeota archaeon]